MDVRVVSLPQIRHSWVQASAMSLLYTRPAVGVGNIGVVVVVSSVLGFLLRFGVKMSSVTGFLLLALLSC